jgi:hypothetical protein
MKREETIAGQALASSAYISERQQTLWSLVLLYKAVAPRTKK